MGVHTIYEMSIAEQRAAARRHLPPPEARRRIRQGARYTLVEAASEIGTTHQSLSRWELRLRAPRGDTIVLYLRFLDRAAAEALR
jgi:transcriptional regulator with XRE-family HTH domain